MFFFLYQDKQVSVNSSAGCSVALAVHAQLHSLGHPCRYVYCDHFLFTHDPVAVTGVTTVLHYASFAMAAATGCLRLHGAQYGLLYARDHPAAVTGLAGLILSSLGAAASAGFAAHVLVHFDFFLNPACYLFERELYFHPEVGPAGNPPALAPSAAETAECAA